MGTEERQSFVARHRASMVVLASQICAACVHGVVKALESGTETVGPFQILLVRMLVTGIGCSLYLWFKKNPEFPLGPRDVRPLLLLRATGGILGAGGMYCETCASYIVIPYRTVTDQSRLLDSISFLTLSQATALNFLAPMGAMILSKYLDHGTFNFTDRIGAAVALAGVVMVVQPEGIFKRTNTLPLGPQPDSFSKVKGLACGAVGVLGTIVSTYGKIWCHSETVR